MPAWLRWCLGLSCALMIAVVPTVYYRATYAHAKRLRVVSAGKLYRCGQLTAAGFREAIARFGIHTVINLQDEDPDPRLPDRYLTTAPAEPESEVCRQAGARYILLNFDLPSRQSAPFEHARVIDEFLKVLDDPANGPVLLHCKAGLHRTGLLTAVYRMEYEHWSVAEALRELRGNGFGDSAATSANDYIFAFIEHYHPRWKKQALCAGPAGQPPSPEGTLP